METKSEVMGEDKEGTLFLKKGIKKFSILLYTELGLIITIFFGVPFVERITQPPEPPDLERLSRLVRALEYANISIKIFFILYIVAIISIIILYKEYKNLKNISQTVNSNPLFLRFKKKSDILKISSIIIVVIISFFLISFEIGKRINEKAVFERGRPMAQSRLKEEGMRTRNNLSYFKETMLRLQNEVFVGYGSVSNNGICYEEITEGYDFYKNYAPGKVFDRAAEGSIFNPGKNFTPKKIISTNGFGKSFFDIYTSAIQPTDLNQHNEARCFSNQEHFAYQVPSFYEEQYPKFYCVDDMYQDVQVRDKRIKGPSCDDLDLNYIAPSVRPIPDTGFYKNYKIQGLEE